MWKVKMIIFSNPQPFPPPPPPRNNNNALKIVGAVVAVVFILAIFVVALPSLMNAGTQVQQRINPPNAAITSNNLRTGTSGLDYIAYLDVSVHNSGGPGNVVVWATVTQGSNEWTKSVSMYMSEQESKDVTLTFTEVGMWTFSDIHSRAWIG